MKRRLVLNALIFAGMKPVLSECIKERITLFRRRARISSKILMSVCSREIGLYDPVLWGVLTQFRDEDYDRFPHRFRKGCGFKYSLIEG